VPNPEFEGQTKTRLGNPEVRKVVENAVGSGAQNVAGYGCFPCCAVQSKLWRVAFQPEISACWTQGLL